MRLIGKTTYKREPTELVSERCHVVVNGMSYIKSDLSFFLAKSRAWTENI